MKISANVFKMVICAAICLPSLGKNLKAQSKIARDDALVVTTGKQLQNAFKQRGTVVLVPGKTYTIVPPLMVDGVLDCRGATITAKSGGERNLNSPLSTLLEASDSIIINGTLDCKGLVNSGLFSRGRLRVLDVKISDYRRKGLHCVYGKDNRAVDSIIVDGLHVTSQKLAPRRTGPAFQYDSSRPC